MILLQTIISILAGSMFDFSAQNFFYSPWVTHFFVSRDLLGFMSNRTNSRFEKSRSAFQGSFRRQLRFHQFGPAINSPVQIIEFPSYFHECLIHFPAQTGLTFPPTFDFTGDQGSEFFLKASDGYPDKIKSFKFDTENFRQVSERELVTQTPEHDFEKSSRLELTSIKRGPVLSLKICLQFLSYKRKSYNRGRLTWSG